MQKMKNLKSLNLTENQLTNIEAIDELTRLEILDLEKNDIQDFTPLEAMTSLKEVNITKNSEQISDLSFLKNLENLENLEISFPEGVDYSVIGKLPKLKFLTIFRSKVGSFDFLLL